MAAGFVNLNILPSGVVQTMQADEYVKMEIEQPPPTEEENFSLAIRSGNDKMISRTLQQKKVREILLDPKKGARAFVFNDGDTPLHKLAKDGVDLAMKVFLDFCLKNSSRLEVGEELNRLGHLPSCLNSIVFAYTGGNFFIMSGIRLRNRENRTPLSLSMEFAVTQGVFHANCATLLLKYDYTPDQINVIAAISSVKQKLEEVRKKIRDFIEMYPDYSLESGGKNWLRVWQIDEFRLNTLLASLSSKL